MRRIKSHHAIHLPEGNVPLQFIRERRKNCRVSIGARQVYLRAPISTPAREEPKLLKWAEDWLKDQFIRKPGLRDLFFKHPVQDGMPLATTYDTFTFRIGKTAGKGNTGKIRNNMILLNLSDGLHEEARQEVLRKLTEKLLSKYYRPCFTQKTVEWHRHIYGEPFSPDRVRLRYTTSKWGSCSQKGKISLSTRLCFAPEKILDYVIIHELCHLRFMNHSPEYWDFVGRIMPDYAKCEAWLKTNGDACGF